MVEKQVKEEISPEGEDKNVHVHQLSVLTVGGTRHFTGRFIGKGLDDAG